MNFDLVHCIWGPWDKWSPCSKPCGTGVQIRSRKVDVHDANGGKPCMGLSTQGRTCNTRKCPAGEDYNCIVKPGEIMQIARNENTNILILP